ncbi:uncharacterized protein F5Z01DRAFT_128638 [Emericellopsis atlantica]|uniref:Uncharacterized protein n=1 Tax=Emericellopsis atlantica TaxID=2614577 RepID=A0A9P8CNH2_9HYPO|nr:uncharacterized protein F5Z01DRAFT_128638 [Emericellopsis atlantica]KAG9253784.1 hypothetical protein F5Z01DRAFT_128638 [Emericellopsis atlantica]
MTGAWTDTRAFVSRLREWQQVLPNLTGESCKPSPKPQDTGPPPTPPTSSPNTVNDPPTSRPEAGPAQEEHPDGEDTRPPSGQQTQTAVANPSSQDDQIVGGPNNPDDGAGGKVNAVADDAAVPSNEVDRSCRTCCGPFRLMCCPLGRVSSPEIRKKPTQMWKFVRGRHGQASPGPDVGDEPQPIELAEQPADHQVTATPAAEQDVLFLDNTENGAENGAENDTENDAESDTDYDTDSDTENDAENDAEQSLSPPPTYRATGVDVVYGRTFDIDEVRSPNNDLRPKQSNSYPELSTADYILRKNTESSSFYDGFFHWFDRCPNCGTEIAWGLPWSSLPESHPSQSVETEWRAPCIHCRQILRATLAPLGQPSLTILASVENIRRHRGAPRLPTVPKENLDNGEGPSTWMERRAESADPGPSNAAAGPVPDRKGKQKMREPQDGDDLPEYQELPPKGEQPKREPLRVQFIQPAATPRMARLLETLNRDRGEPRSLDAVLSQEMFEDASTDVSDASSDPEQPEADEDGIPSRQP